MFHPEIASRSIFDSFLDLVLFLQQIAWKKVDDLVESRLHKSAAMLIVPKLDKLEPAVFSIFTNSKKSFNRSFKQYLSPHHHSILAAHRRHQNKQQLFYRMCDFTLPEDIIDLLEGDSAVCHGIDSLSCPSVFTESLTEEFSCTKLKDSSLVGATVGRLFKMKEGLIYYYDETGQNLKHKHHPVANGTTIEVDRKKMSITLKTKLDGKTLTLSDFKNISLIGGKDAKSADELLDLVEKRIKYHSAICEIRSRMGIKLYAELVQGKFNPPHTLFEPGTPTLEKAKKVLSQLRSMMDSEPLIEFRDNGGGAYIVCMYLYISLYVSLTGLTGIL